MGNGNVLHDAMRLAWYPSFLDMALLPDATNRRVNGMVAHFVTYYRNGCIAGLAVALVPWLFFAIIYLWEKRQRKIPRSTSTNSLEQPDTPEKNSVSRSVGIECGIYAGVSILLIIVFYLWVTPVIPYKGVVEDTVKRVSMRRWNRVSHYVVVQGKKRPVSGDIFERVTKGDTIVHKFARQWYSINGTRYMAKGYTTNTGFWTGFIGMSGFIVCCFAWFGRKKWRGRQADA